MLKSGIRNHFKKSKKGFLHEHFAVFKVSCELSKYLNYLFESAVGIKTLKKSEA